MCDKNPLSDFRRIGSHGGIDPISECFNSERCNGSLAISTNLLTNFSRIKPWQSLALLNRSVSCGLRLKHWQPHNKGGSLPYFGAQLDTAAV